MQPLDLGAHLDAQLGIEVGQWLIEQEQVRIAHDGAAHGNALALAARELAGLAVEQMLDLQQFGRPLHRRLALCRRHFAHFEAEADIAAHGHGRIERVGLEHHGDVAILGMHVVDIALADENIAARAWLKPGDDRQQRGLAAARRAQQDQETAVLQLDIDGLENLQRTKALADALDG